MDYKDVDDKFEVCLYIDKSTGRNVFLYQILLLDAVIYCNYYPKKWRGSLVEDDIGTILIDSCPLEFQRVVGIKKLSIRQRKNIVRFLNGFADK